MPKRTKHVSRKPVTISGELVANTAYSQVRDYFGRSVATNPKHNFSYDFGYPECITFQMYYQMYSRNGLANAGIRHAINRTWREYPALLEKEEAHDQTSTERLAADAFKRLSFWQKLKDADLRSRVGEYGALVLRFADGKQPNQPVQRLAGLDALVELIPCYQDQLEPTQFDTNPASINYGKPTMYQFNEARVDPKRSNNRSFMVHPDRVHIWSADGGVNGDPVLEPGFNDLITLEKIMGSGGEGFWKNAKSAPVLNVDPLTNLQSLASMLGTDVAGIADKMDEVIAGWQRGFDQLLMLQGIDTKTLAVTLPQPAEFLAGPMQSFAASINEPLKILIGSQSGERASTEDAKEWDSTIMSRRMNYVIPNMDRLFQKLSAVGVLPLKSWHVSWTDLTEDSLEEKLANAKALATINKELLGTGERAFTAQEIREAAGYMVALEDDVILPEDENNDEAGA